MDLLSHPLAVQLERDHSGGDGGLMAAPERWYFSIFPFSAALPPSAHGTGGALSSYWSAETDILSD